MRTAGVSELLRRAQEFVGPSAGWLDVLAEEKRGTLTLYRYTVPGRTESWRGHYAPWAKISPIDATQSLFVLSYYKDNKKWQDLEVAGHFEECLQAVKDNVLGLFFS